MPTPRLLDRHDQPEEFVELAKAIFQDTLMRVYEGVRATTPSMRGVSESVVFETDELVAAGKWSEAARFARVEFAPWFFEMAVHNDDFETHKRATVLIGSLYFYEVLFSEVGQ